MILVLGNFAGVFSNICKILNWSFHLDDNDTILFYYTNKREHNDNGRVLPFQTYEKDLSRIFFYKYFEYPPSASLNTFLQANQFEMMFPPASALSLTVKSYFDPSFPMIRQAHFEHIQKRLQFTPLMKALVEKEVAVLRQYQAAGKRIAAVYLRSTGHFVHSFNIDALFQEIHTVVKEYDYILPITQIQSFFDRSKQEFQEKVISFPRNYMQQDVDWKKNVSDEEFEEEFKMAIVDVYVASQCDFILGGPSNMFAGSLFFNPTVPFHVFQELNGKELV